MKPLKLNILFQGDLSEFEELKEKSENYVQYDMSFYFLKRGTPLFERAQELNDVGLITLSADSSASAMKLLLFLAQLELKIPARSFEMIKASEFKDSQELYWPVSHGQGVQKIQKHELQNFADALVPSDIYYYPEGTLQKKNAQEDYRPVYLPSQLKDHGPLQKALFLDRDGVVIKDAGYNIDSQMLELIPETLELMKKASSEDYLVIILTNQSGVGRGYFDMTQVNELHHDLEKKLNAEGVQVDAWFTSPYHFEKGQGRYKKHSLTRKPGAGLVIEALEKWPIDLSASFMMGDKPSDDLDIPKLKTLHLKGDYDLSGVVSPVLNSALEALKEL